MFHGESSIERLKWSSTSLILIMRFTRKQSATKTQRSESLVVSELDDSNTSNLSSLSDLGSNYEKLLYNLTTSCLIYLTRSNCRQIRFFFCLNICVFINPVVKRKGKKEVTLLIRPTFFRLLT